MTRTVVLPPPIPAKDLSDHARRAARAFERVHRMLEAKAAAERGGSTVAGKPLVAEDVADASLRSR